MGDEKKPLSDPLFRNRVFPEAGQVFQFEPVPVDIAVKEGIIAVDTNVLLVPYTTGSSSLKSIRSTYERLAREGRLRIPGQAAREFADLRADKLKTLYQDLSKRRNADLGTGRSPYPLLDGLPAYKDLLESEAKILEEHRKSRELLGKLLEAVAAWQWDDPVSKIYREFFQGDIVVDPDVDPGECLADLTYRQEHRVPPGYKDAGKEDLGVGDLLIWRTLLQIGKKEGKHLVFVSGEQKPDWRYRSDNRALYPRFELVDEYRRASGGKSIHIIKFADLLKSFETPKEVIEEVKKEELNVAIAKAGEAFADAFRKASESPIEGFVGHQAEEAVFRWLCERFGQASVSRVGRGPFDFLVATPSGAEGYEVKYLSNREDIIYKVAAAVANVQNRSRVSSVPITLVVVVPDLLYVARISLVVQPASAWLPNSVSTRIIIGVVDPTGIFQPINHNSIGPDAPSQSA